MALNNDVLRIIFSHLNPLERLAVRRSSKQWNNVALDEQYWSTLNKKYPQSHQPSWRKYVHSFWFKIFESNRDYMGPNSALLTDSSSPIIPFLPPIVRPATIIGTGDLTYTVICGSYNSASTSDGRFTTTLGSRTHVSGDYNTVVGSHNCVVGVYNNVLGNFNVIFDNEINVQGNYVLRFANRKIHYKCFKYEIILDE